MILARPSTRVVVQGISGRQATWCTEDLISYGTRVVAGVVPGRGGSRHAGVPVFDLVADAVAETGADASLVFVPAHAATEAIREAIEAGVRLVVYPGDGMPVHDSVRLRRAAQRAGATLVGPNTPGLISPGHSKLGFMPSYCFRPGRLGVITKSGSLSYETSWRLTGAGIGQSTVVGVGGDAVKGLTIGEALALFHDDPETAAMLVLGEIGGVEEYQIIDYRQRPQSKPVAAFLVGRTAPPGRKLGHAGALVNSDRESYASKVAALEAAGIPVARSLADVVPVVSELATGLVTPSAAYSLASRQTTEELT